MLGYNFSIAAECELSVSITYPASINYQDQSPIYQYTINLLKTNQDPCSGRIGISPGLSDSYNRKLYNGSNFLTYNVFKGQDMSQILKDLPDSIGSSDYITYNFEEGENILKQIDFFLKTDNDQQPSFLKRAGLYTDTLSINFYPTDSTISYKTILVSPSAQVSSIFAIRVGPENQTYSNAMASTSLTFTTENQTRNSSIYVLANDEYSISISSENFGKLVHSDNSNFSIPYQTFLNNTQISLLQPNITNHHQVTESSGKEFILTFSVEMDPRSLLFGNYTDTVTVSVFPVE
jgi:spore coat protein U-like protein